MRHRLINMSIIAVAFLVMGLTGAVVALKTQVGIQVVASQFARSLSTPGMQVDISGMSGDGFDEIHIASVTVEDGAGVWLTATNIDFAWRPWALLNGRLHISQLSVGEIAFDRMPTADAGVDTTPTGLPKLPVGLKFETLKLHKIILSPAVVGDKMALRLSGHMASDAVEGLSSSMRLEALEGEGAALSFDANIDPSQTNLTLRLDAREPQRGLIGRLVGAANSPAMALSVSGTGPLAAWPGTFDFVMGAVAAQPDAHIAGTLDANLNDAFHLQLRGQAQAAPILPSQLSALNFDVRTHVDLDAWAASIDAFSINAGAWHAEGNMALQLESLVLEGRIKADVTQAITLTNGLSYDSGHVTVDLGGVASAPEIDMKGTLNAPKIAGLSARMMAFDGHVAAPIADKGAPFELRVNLDAPLTGQAFVDTLLVGGALIKANGSILADDSHVVLDGLTLTGRDFSLLGEGWGDYADMTGELSINGQLPNFARLSIPGFSALQGHASVHADVHGGPSAVEADWRVQILQPKTGLAVLDPWFGPELSAAGALSTPDGDAWRLESVTVKSATTLLRGEAAFTASTGRVDSQFTGEAETLAPFGAALSTTIGGRTQIQGSITGLLSDPDLTLSIQATEPRIGSFQGELAELDFHVRAMASAPSGQAALQVVFDGEKASGKSTFAMRAGQDLRFDHIRIQAAGGTATGELVWEIPTGLATGNANVEAMNLRSLGRIAGMDLGGTVHGSITLGHDRRVQRMSGEVSAEKLNLPNQDLRIAHMSLKANGQQGSGLFTFDGTAKLSEVATSYGAINTAVIKVQGTQSQADATLILEGPKEEIERLSLHSLVRRDGDIWTAEISSLYGLVQAVPLTLKEPTRLSYSSSRLMLECSTFAIADGQARACLDFTPDRVDGSMILSALPVSMFSPWIPAQSDWYKSLQGGVVGLDMTLKGTLQNPSAQFHFSLDDVGLSTNASLLDTVNLNASGTFNRNFLSVKADVSGPGDTRGHMQLHLPGILSLSPFVIAINEQDLFDAELRFDGTLDGVQRLVPLDPHRISGTVKAQMTARGNLSAPLWDGTMRLKDGRYENLKTGTNLKGIEFDLQGNGDTLTVNVLRASDGAKGSLEGHGKIIVTGLKNATFDIALDLNNLHVVRRDDITAVATGSVSVTGVREALHITGKLIMSPVEIRIPDTLPAEVVALPISHTVGAPSAPTQSLVDQTGVPSLDMTVDVPGRMFLRGRGLTSEWAGHFKILQHNAVVQIEGALRPVRGEYQFAGKTFRLVEGTVAFVSGEDLVPVLNLAAEYSRRDFKAIINIVGPANMPRIILTSVPELPQDEILARVLFGRSTGQLSPVEVVQLAEAVTQLSGSRSFDGGGLETLRKAIGTDVLRFEGGDSGQGPSAKAGKYVTDEVYVGVKQGTTPKSTGATIEIELTPNISLDSQVHQDSSSHVGVKWKWDY